MRRRGPLRVVILPCEIAGYGAGLSQGLAELGHRVEVFEVVPHPFGYDTPAVSSPTLRALSRVAVAARSRGWARRAALTPAEVMLRALAAVVVAVRYDVLVYLGQTLLVGWDLRLARLLRRTTVVVFLGSDARPPYLSGFYLRDVMTRRGVRRLERRTKLVAHRVRTLERLATACVNHPPHAQFHRRRYLDFLSVGFPIASPRGGAPTSPPSRPGHDVIRILHAPSRPDVKGTERLRTAVSDLAATGRRVQLVELVGVPNAEVRQVIAGCHLVVDELYSDTLLAGLATEAATTGVAVLVFGYASALLGTVAEPLSMPTEQYGPPDQLDAKLRRYVDDGDARDRLARQLCDFVGERWEPAEVARRLLAAVEEPDAGVWRTPGELPYAYGFGLELDTLRDRLHAYVAAAGDGALRLPPGDPTARLIAELLADD